MIFRQTGLKSNVLKVIDTDKTALETLASTNTPTISQDEDIKLYKANNMMYFISGDIKPNEDGSYTRNDNNLNSRDLIIIDIEDTGLISQEVQDIIQERLESYKYLLYSTISHKQNNPRLRLVLEPSREILKDEYKPTIQHVIQLLNIKYDTSSCTWSQLQGLPIAVSDNEHIFIKHLDGEAYPVQEAVKKKKKTASYKVDGGVSISDEDYTKMFNRYLELDYENINTEDDNNYNRALGILLSLSRDVCYNVISYDVACECSDLLANIGANPEKYRQENIEKINHAIRSWESDSNFFENGQSYSMLQRFEIVGNEKDKNFLYSVRYKQNKPISSTRELHWRLFTTGEQWRVENTKIDKGGNEKIPVMNFNIISSILKKHIPMKLTGETEDTSIIYSYNFSEGIYTGQEAYINRAIAKLEHRFDPGKYTQVYKFLKTQLPFSPRLEDKNLIAVNNGIFNDVTKEYEYFNSNYFITSKLATKYNIHAIENYEAIRKDYDVDDWFLSIANGDEELVIVFWQMIKEAINPNYTREKMAILYGEGNNGKGTFQAMLTNLIGIENISTLTPHDFSGEFKLEMLQGKVCNIGDDISNKYLDDMSNLMSIVTGDPVAVNRKGKSVITTRFKLFNIFSANRLPRVRNKSQGTYRRLLIVPFNADFNGAVQDRRIKDEYLKNEIVLEYILYKALHLEHFDRFTVPKVSENLLEEYKESNDYQYSFVKDWYIGKGLNEVERVPVSLIKDMFRHYLTVNYYECKFTSSFGRDISIYLNTCFKENDYKFSVDRVKLTKKDKIGLKSALSEVEYKGKIPENTVHCIVKS